MPIASPASPTKPRIAAGTRSDSRPAIGAETPTATGHGVISSPVSTWLRPSSSSK